MNNIAILQEMLEYIDSHIMDKMNVEILAQRAGFSPHYFCRMFLSGVGTSIMEYVRNRRLAYAAAELSSGRKILDIAVDYGFETHSGFSKAFLRYFRCPPEIFRSYASFKVPEIPDLSKPVQFETAKIIEPKIMATKETFKIAGYPEKVVFKEGVILEKVGIFKEECITDGRMEKLHAEPFIKHHAECGACFYKEGDDNSVYVFGLEVHAGYKIPADYSIFSIPKSLYAVFLTTPTIEDTWDYIFSEWLPNSGYELDTNGIPFELFYGKTIDYSFCDIYVPVVKIQL